MMNIFVASATAPTMVYPHAYSPRRAGIACQLSSGTSIIARSLRAYDSGRVLCFHIFPSISFTGMLKKSGLIAIKQYPSFKCAISRRKVKPHAPLPSSPPFLSLTHPSPIARRHPASLQPHNSKPKSNSWCPTAPLNLGNT